MGWEIRRGKPCYYRKVREGKRVRSIYCGFGWRGQQAAAEDAERRRQAMLAKFRVRASKPKPAPKGGTPITRDEIVRRATERAPAYLKKLRPAVVELWLGLNKAARALELAGVTDEEIERRGLAL